MIVSMISKNNTKEHTYLSDNKSELPSSMVVPWMQKLKNPPWWEPRAIKGSLSKHVVGQNIALDVMPAYTASIPT